MIATTTNDAERYLASVRTHLSDLPEAEREDLLEDLSEHLAEVAAESDEPLEQRIGPPAEYAAELRTSAGLADGTGAVGGVGGVGVAARAARARAERLLADPRAAAVRAYVAQLRPAWWLVRGYALVLAWAISGSIYARAAMPWPRIAGSRWIGVLLTVAATVFSVQLARRTSRRAKALSLVVNVLAGFAVLAIASTVYDTSMQAFYFTHGEGAYGDDGSLDPDEYRSRDSAAELFGGSTPGLYTSDGLPVLNIYPYDTQGRPLDNVRLYDHRGEPLDLVVDVDENGSSVVTSYPLDQDGRPVTNAFPQRQVIRDEEFDAYTDEYDQQRQSELGVPPAIEVPPLATATPAPTPAPQPSAADRAEKSGGQQPRKTEP